MLRTGSTLLPATGRALALGCALATVGGCQLVSGLGGLETDSTGGAGGAGSTTVTTGATTTGSSSSSSVTSTSTSSSTGSGGPPLPRCGAISDDFDAGIDANVWTATGVAAPLAMGVGISGGATSTLRMVQTSLLSECYTSVRIRDTSGATIDDFLGFNGGLGNLVLLEYQPTSLSLSSTYNGTPTTVIGATPDALGVAVHGSNVYFLYRSTQNGPWQFYAQFARPAWMDTVPAAPFIGALKSSTGQSVTYDDFNVVPISVTDLP